MTLERQILREATYPSYMTLSLSDMESIFDSFVNIFKSIWQSLKLLTATLKLNLQVLAGTITNNRQMIDDAYTDFQKSRQDYDTKMANNLKYFKKYYMESRFDTLGGFGPKILAFAANPLLFASSKVSSATVGRGSGTLAPWDKSQGPIEMLFGKSRGSTGDFEGRTSATTTSTAAPAAATATTVTRIAASDRVKRALKFFEYDASLSEAVEPAFNLPPGVSEEIKKLNTIAREFVSSEKQRGDEFLSKISDIVNSLREITNAKTFEELIASLKAAEARGIKLTVSEVQTASKKIRDELEKQRKEDPEKFKQAVMTMRQKSSDIKEPDDVSAAMLFMFGIAKSNVQQQLIKMQESLLSRVRSVMNLPIDEEVRKELQQSGIGEEYLRFIDGFERTLTTGEKETESLRKSFKSAKTRL